MWHQLRLEILLQHLSSRVGVAPGEAVGESTSTSRDRARAVHDHLSQLIHRVLLAQAGICVLAVSIVLGSSDVSLILPDSETRSLFGVQVSLEGLLFLVPFSLVPMVWYLQVLNGNWQQCDQLPPRDRLPYIFNLTTRSSRVAAGALFYWLVPATLFLVWWKASALEVGPWFGLIAVASVVVHALLQLKRRPRLVGPTVFINWALVVLCLASILPGNGERRAGFFLRHKRQFRLAGEDLSGSVLYARQLANASLRGARMKNMDIVGLFLEEVDVRSVNLEGSRIQHSALLNVSAENASFQGTRWTRVAVEDSNLQGASFQGSILTQVRFTKSSLAGTDFGGATVRGWLKGVDLAGANLDNADLRAVQGLEARDLEGACITLRTQLPDELATVRASPTRSE